MKVKVVELQASQLSAFDFVLSVYKVALRCSTLLESVHIIAHCFISVPVNLVLCLMTICTVLLPTERKKACDPASAAGSTDTSEKSVEYPKAFHSIN